jgi:dihydrofolate reductase
MISLIVALDEQNGMGKNNHLLCHLPADLQFFKKNTLGKPIIMGRKTFESIGRVLPDRPNIIVSHQMLQVAGATVVKSLDEALAQTRDYPEIMIIGGAQVFAEALPKAQRIYLTRIHHRFTADVFFPNLDEKTWICKPMQYHPADEKNSYAMTFYHCERLQQ